MFITPPQNGAYEQIFANYYLIWNEWLIHDWMATAPIESNTMNLRGMVVSLVLDNAVFTLANTPFNAPAGPKPKQLQNIANAKYGQAVINESASQPAQSLKYEMDLCPVGVLESDMWTGTRGPGGTEQPKSDCWVTVQIYGYNDRIARSSTGNGQLLVTGSSGICDVVDFQGQVGATLTHPLAGYANCFNSLDPSYLFLNGLNGGTAPSTRIEWATLPKLDEQSYVSSSASPPGPAAVLVARGTGMATRSVIGYMFRGTGKLTWEKNYGATPRHGFIATCEGFIMCMGINVGRI